MRIQLYATSVDEDFVTDFTVGWHLRCPEDCLETQLLAPLHSAIPALRWSDEAELIVVFETQVLEASRVDNLVNLVLRQALRRSTQPVIALAHDTVLSRRQLSESGLSGCYLRSEHPQRDGIAWGKVLGQTWHVDD